MSTYHFHDNDGRLFREHPGDLRIADDDLRAVLEGTRHLLLDGAMGTMLQAAGLKAGELPELLCVEHPDVVEGVHRAYVEAGSEAVTTNTFGANAHKLAGALSVDDCFAAAIGCARRSGARYVVADIGPIGALLRPLGTLSFDEAYDLFAEQAEAAERHGADIILIETMTDLLETKAAVLAAKERTNLPVFATMTFEADGRTFLGTSPEVAATTLAALGVEALGVNCSLGPTELAPIIGRMLAVTDTPVMVQANAGLPRVEDGRTVYDVTPDAYAEAVRGMVDAGVGIVGGCCGTNPSYIKLVREILDSHEPKVRTVPAALNVTSAQSIVRLEAGSPAVAVIGERINPTGKKRLKAALVDHDLDYLVGQAISQQEQGADILDVNVGLPEIDEATTIREAVEAVQGASLLPLQIDSSDPAAIEAGVRAYAGKPIVNSVNAKDDNLAAVLPIVRHYGCAVVGLTLDEDGIPETAERRLALAEKIVATAESYGIPRQDVLIDCLVMTASTNQRQVVEILRAVSLVKQRLGVRTALGVSNVSFGLPQRALLNSTFLAAAFGAGLDCPIMNPGSARYMDVVRSYRVLDGEDAGSTAYIERYADWVDPYKGGAAGAGAAGGTETQTGGAASGGGAASAPGASEPATPAELIHRLILTGRKGEVPEATRELLADMDAMDVINDVLIPALDEVGGLFDQGKFFLPQLMASAEAARAGFDTIKATMPANAVAEKGKIALATVKGDIHDIGKNIVKMLLDNYGYRVFDLGRDVDPQAVLDCVRERGVRLVGLSALMTTTVRNMEETIELLHREAPEVRVFVGGAVLTADYAERIGADWYAKDAAESARIAERFFAEHPDA